MDRRSNVVRALLMATTVFAAGAANAASEQTRRNYNAIQNYQNRQQTPYYSGQTNPYYGTPPQGARGNPVPPPPATNALPNQLRQIERNRNGQ